MLWVFRTTLHVMCLFRAFFAQSALKTRVWITFTRNLHTAPELNDFGRIRQEPQHLALELPVGMCVAKSCDMYTAIFLKKKRSSKKKTELNKSKGLFPSSS